MKYLLPILFLIACSGVVEAQKIGLSQSVKIWGQTEGINKIHYMDKNFFISYSTTKNINQINTSYRPTITVAKKMISYSRFDLFASFSTVPFPVYNSSMYNFLIRVNIFETDKFSINYMHFSNGFKLFHNVNLGADFFSFNIKI